MSENNFNNEFAEVINLCKKYWKTYTLDKSKTVYENQIDFTDLILSKTDKKQFKFIDSEDILRIIAKYRQDIEDKLKD